MSSVARSTARRWLLPWALLCFALLSAALYAPSWRAGPRTSIPTSIDDLSGVSRRQMVSKGMKIADHLLVVATVARNARVLTSQPGALFDAESCYPQPRALALGEPMITMGLLGIPAWIATRDPVLTYNTSLVVMTLIAGLAMYALVTRWTGIASAGIMAGILYAFGAPRLWDGIHPYVYDTSWTVLALLISRELFARGRWFHALLLPVCCGLQMSTSFYPFLTSVLIALPFAVWLVATYGLSKLRWGHLVAVGVGIAVAAWLVFGPYLELRETTELGRASAANPQIFGRWSALLPGGHYYSGGLALLFAALALAPPIGRSARRLEGDPRWALVVGGVLAALVAAGGNAVATRLGSAPISLPNFYALLSPLLPGLDQVRVPATLFSGLHLVVCVLAGIGAAGVLRRVPPRAFTGISAALVILTAILVLGPAPVGAGQHYRPYRVSPQRQALEFFDRLEVLGDDGPLLEVFANPRDFVAKSASVLLTAYHGRPTSACRNSFLPPVARDVERLVGQIPDPQALEKLRKMGFQTLLVHHPPGRAGRKSLRATDELKQRLERSVAGAGESLRLLHADAQRTAYSLEPR